MVLEYTQFEFMQQNNWILPFCTDISPGFLRVPFLYRSTYSLKYWTRLLSIGKSVSPSVRQSVSASVLQSFSPSVRQPVSSSVRQSVIPSVRQPVSPSIVIFNPFPSRPWLRACSSMFTFLREKEIENRSEGLKDCRQSKSGVEPALILFLVPIIVSRQNH